MCIGDWRFGRFIHSRYSGLIIAGINTVVLPARPTRVGILVSADNGIVDTPQAVFITDTITSEVLAIVNNGNSPYMFSLKDHGDFVTRALTITGYDSSTGTVTEFELPEAMLSVALESFYTDYPKMRG